MLSYLFKKLRYRWLIAWAYGCLKTRQHGHSLIRFQAAHALDDSRPDAMNGLGLLFFDLKQYPNAVCALKVAIECDPTKGVLWHNLSRTYYDWGDHDLEVLYTADEAIARGNCAHPADVYAVKGAALLRLKQYGEAAACYRQAVELNPGNHVYQFNYASSLAASGNIDEAIAQIRKARAILDDPKTRDLLMRLRLSKRQSTSSTN
ncbi:MAG: tetratricopeptide repeat protein [Cyanobacteria bacterium P01_H01_bin.121]